MNTFITATLSLALLLAVTTANSGGTVSFGKPMPQLTESSSAWMNYKSENKAMGDSSTNPVPANPVESYSAQSMTDMKPVATDSSPAVCPESAMQTSPASPAQYTNTITPAQPKPMGYQSATPDKVMQADSYQSSQPHMYGSTTPPQPSQHVETTMTQSTYGSVSASSNDYSSDGSYNSGAGKSSSSSHWYDSSSVGKTTASITTLAIVVVGIIVISV